MNISKKAGCALLIAFFVAIAVLGVYLGFKVGKVNAAGSAGTKDDPLVTLSYLNEVFKPEINAALAKKADEAAAENRALVESAVAGYTPPEPRESEYSSVTLYKDQKVTLANGTNAFFAGGEVTFTSGKLFDMSASSSPAAKAVIPAYHWVFSTGDSVLTVTGDSVVMTSSGAYKID